MDSTGASVVVNKKCADTTECLPRAVGCVLVDTQTVREQMIVTERNHYSLDRLTFLV